MHLHLLELRSFQVDSKLPSSWLYCGVRPTSFHTCSVQKKVFFTAHIRIMNEGNISVCPHLQEVPYSQVWMGGTPFPGLEGGNHIPGLDRGGGTTSQVWTGGTISQVWNRGVPPIQVRPQDRMGGGTPSQVRPQVRTRGYPLPRTGWGTLSRTGWTSRSSENTL